MDGLGYKAFIPDTPARYSKSLFQKPETNCKGEFDNYLYATAHGALSTGCAGEVC